MTMPTVGVLTLELHIEDAHSLKDKRHTVKSLKDRLRSKFNVAVAEIDYQDLWQRSLVSAVTVSGDHAHAEQVLQLVEREAAHLLGGVLVGTTSSGLNEGYFKQLVAMRSRQQRTAEELRALQAVAEHDGEKIQALVRVAEQRLKAMENRRK